MSDSDQARIKKQVEFYFSDANFPRDKFLISESAKDPDGCTPVAPAAHDDNVRSPWSVNVQGSS